jgi:hypothetical protein
VEGAQSKNDMSTEQEQEHVFLQSVSLQLSPARYQNLDRSCQKYVEPGRRGEPRPPCSSRACYCTYPTTQAKVIECVCDCVPFR